MKGTEKIVAHILSDADAKAGEIISDAQKSCDEIKAKFDAQASAAYEAAKTASMKEADDRLESARRMNEMETKKAALNMKQAQVSVAFEKAVCAIPALPDGKYEAVLVSLAKGAMSSRDEEIVLNERDAAIGQQLVDRINKETGAKLTLSPERGDFAGGLILRRGKTSVNATLELLMELSRRDISPDVAAVLFK